MRDALSSCEAVKMLRRQRMVRRVVEDRPYSIPRTLLSTNATSPCARRLQRLRGSQPASPQTAPSWVPSSITDTYRAPELWSRGFTGA